MNKIYKLIKKIIEFFKKNNDKLNFDNNEKLTNSFKVIKSALEKDILYLQYVPDKMYNKRKFIKLFKKLFLKNPYLISYNGLPNKLKNDINIIKELYMIHPHIENNDLDNDIIKELVSDKDFVLNRIKTDPILYKYCDYKIKADVDVIEEFLKATRYSCIDLIIDKNYFNVNFSMAIKSISVNPRSYYTIIPNISNIENKDKLEEIFINKMFEDAKKNIKSILFFDDIHLKNEYVYENVKKIILDNFEKNKKAQNASLTIIDHKYFVIDFINLPEQLKNDSDIISSYLDFYPVSTKNKTRIFLLCDPIIQYVNENKIENEMIHNKIEEIEEVIKIIRENTIICKPNLNYFEKESNEKNVILNMD